MNKTVLEVKDLHKIYDNRTHAVRGISFSIYEGEIFGLIGPNGAGKTTTLRMIAGLLKPTKGTILLEGMNILTHTEEIKGLIGYLPEEAEVYPRLTGMEHIYFYAKLYGHNDNIGEMIDYAVKISGLGEKLREKAGTYSKGMKRRLLLAIALMRKPRLAILDEPTSGLDVYASVRVRKLIKEYVRETGSAVIISSHNMLEVEYLCDRVAFMYNGKIITMGSPHELIKKYNVENLEEAFVKAIEEQTK
ncbi:MAG: ABC transporter ATP-binding protein [Staphylothermus sp.]|nr:ABC transporter ATP-binding protein [Staphylothermus sp.]